MLKRQKDAGLEIFTDGELRRTGFMSDFYESVEGLDPEYELDRTWKGAADRCRRRQRAVGAPGGAVVAKIRQTKRLTKHEVDFLKRHAPGDIKMTLPTANQFPAIAYKKGISERAYPTYSEFLWDIVPIIKAEIHALVNEGVKYIQIDAPRYSYYIDPKWRRHIQEEMGVDPEAALDEAIRVDNACLEGVEARRRVTLAMHLCRGNNRSQWYAEGGYDPIAEQLFNQLNVDVFLLEYESERAGTFDPLRFVPRSKSVVLGLVSSKLPALEPQDAPDPPDRGGEPLRAAREPGAEPAVRLRLDDGGQPAERAGPVAQAGAGRRDRAQGLEGRVIVGFIGFGEAGSTIAGGLPTAGVERIVTFDIAATTRASVRRSRARRRAAARRSSSRRPIWRAQARSCSPR